MAEARQKVFRFLVFGLVREALVSDGLRAPEFVDADDHRLEAFQHPNDFEVHQHEAQNNHREHGDGNLEITARDDRGSVLLKIELLCFVERRIAHEAAPSASATFSNRAVAEAPDVPLKMWLVSVGTLTIA